MSEVILAEVKKAHDGMRSDFEEFKRVNDQRLEALKKGHSTAEMEQKLERINASIESNEKVQRDWLSKREEDAKRIADLDKKFEAFANRAEKALGGGAPNIDSPEAKAFDRYLRAGFERLSSDETKVLSRSDDTTGGFLAPAHVELEIIKGVVEFSPVRELVRVRTVGGPEFQQPKRTQTAAATRVGEVSARGETQNPAWGLLKIAAPEMYAEARISQQNLEDSAYNLEAELNMEFAEQFGVKEGQEFVSGNGVNQILGILDANAAGVGVPLATSNSGAAATIAGPAGDQAKGLIDVFYGLKTAYAARARWLLNRSSLGKVRSLKDSNGQYLWAPGMLSMGAPATILGAPYTECPDMPNEAAGALPIAFGDWQRAFTLLDRVGMSITRDPYTHANVGQVKFTARRRTGGQLVLAEAARALKCAA